VNNVQGSTAGYRVQVTWYKVQDSGTWQSGTPFGVPPARVRGSRFKAQGSRYRAPGSPARCMRSKPPQIFTNKKSPERGAITQPGAE